MNTAAQCIHVNNATDFENLIREKERVVGLFYAMWCPFCVRFLAAFEKGVAHGVPGKDANVRFVMVEDVAELEDNYAVEVVPTVLYFENGNLAKRLDGILGVGLNESQLMKFLDTI